MIDVNKEAEEYAKDLIESKSAQPHESTWVSSIFISGHNSKATQAKVIQGQIDVLLKYQQKLGGYDVLSGLLKQEIEINIYELRQKLLKLLNGGLI
jgi:CRISPR/Cas system type I-B associated protein Csh2 (Cas7 group RAMP superfamily)